MNRSCSILRQPKSDAGPLVGRASPGVDRLDRTDLAGCFCVNGPNSLSMSNGQIHLAPRTALAPGRADLGSGSYVPERVVTNQDLQRQSRVRSRSGSSIGRASTNGDSHCRTRRRATCARRRRSAASKSAGREPERRRPSGRRHIHARHGVSRPRPTWFRIGSSWSARPSTSRRRARVSSSRWSSRRSSSPRATASAPW